MQGEYTEGITGSELSIPCGIQVLFSELLVRVGGGAYGF